MAAAPESTLPLRADHIPWEQLSVESVSILRQVVAPMHLWGETTTEVAKRLRIPLGSVRLLTDYFASEASQLAQPSCNAEEAGRQRAPTPAEAEDRVAAALLA